MPSRVQQVRGAGRRPPTAVFRRERFQRRRCRWCDTVKMLSELTSRSSLLGRSTRAGLAWLALLALALPGFASMRGLCCEPGLAKSSDCCATQLKTTAMKMPGMDSSQMAGMESSAVTADAWVAVTATRCAPGSDSEIPEFIVRSEGSFDARPLLHPGFHPALAWNWDAGISSSATSALPLVEGRPPRLLLSDPLSFVLRI